MPTAEPLYGKSPNASPQWDGKVRTFPSPSAWSIPWGIDRYFDLLEKAAKK